MQPTIVNVDLGERSYDIVITSGDLAGLGPFARRAAKGVLAFIIADEHVSSHASSIAMVLQGAEFEVETAVVPPGETQKSLAATEALYSRLLDAGADRHTLVVPVGGGVIGDLAGFVAATYARGLPWLILPTTLLAMVDSSVGGKVAVNHAKAKNLIGAFHQPVGVWIDISVLATLPDREYRSGLAEVVKYGVILDADLFAYLETHAEALLKREADVLRQTIARCCQLKANIVERDERELTGLRAVLNYGHTFAHAFETAGGYRGWLHGEAVAAGMICASRLAEVHGLVERSLTERQQRLLTRFGLPTKPLAWEISGLLRTMKSDKKAIAGSLRFVLPRRLGEVDLFDMPESAVAGVLQEAMS